ACPRRCLPWRVHRHRGSDPSVEHSAPKARDFRAQPEVLRRTQHPVARRVTPIALGRNASTRAPEGGPLAPRLLTLSTMVRDDLRMTEFRLGDDDLVVLSFPLAGGAELARLTTSESEVALAVVTGKSNREIAHERGRSIMTVANQVASVFRKLRV